ncbi:MAG: glutaredoxin family protein [Gammaproteobacteria bacterium]
MRARQDQRARRAILAMMTAAALALLLAAGARAEQVEVFVRAGCPHCEAAHLFLETLQRERPDVRIIERDVGREPGALERLLELSARHGEAMPGVPSFLIGGQFIVGYESDATTGAHLRRLLGPAPAPDPAPATPTCPATSTTDCDPSEEGAFTLFGRTLSAGEIGLPLFSVVLGLVDGLNPCSMWVLVFMLAILAPMRDRRRMVAIAGTFVVVEGIAYFLFMSAWLNAFMLVGASRISEIAIGLVGCAAGAMNLKDFVAPGHGPSLAIPAGARPGLYARLRGIVRTQALVPAIAATVALAITVQIVEFMCTAGIPALYTRILTLHALQPLEYYGNLVLYNLAYMLDDAIVLAVGVATLNTRRMQRREGRLLKLGSGLTLIALGIWLLAPGR